MRTVKASEVVKGMRVRVEQRFTHPPLVKGGAEDETIETIEGTVTVCANANITFANGETRYLGYDHPVTVLAEPEPEWVEGAWYWVELTSEPRRPLKRLAGGWTCYDDDRAWFSDDSYPDITVLGRVLIVDWPGDDVAEEIDRSFYSHNGHEHKTLTAVADAIRTQGGVR